MSNIIFIIGPPRSGTSLFGLQILKEIPEINYIGEKNWVWKFGNAYKNHEVLNYSDLTQFKKRYIKDFFNKVSSNEKITVEKTPANCLRIPYILGVFPNAKFIFLYRNGNNTVRSIIKEWLNEGIDAYDGIDVRKMKGLKKVIYTLKRDSDWKFRSWNFIELIEMPVYLSRLYNLILRYLFKITPIWGPRIPELKKILKKEGLEMACAKQWAYCANKIISDKEMIDKNNYFIVSYEELIDNTYKVLNDVAGFIDINLTEQKLTELSNKVEKKNNEITKLESLSNIIEPVQQKINNETNNPRP